MSSLLSIYDLVGDLVIYRNLDPLDLRLPRFLDAWPAMGLATQERPRKLDAAYARALVWLLQRARWLDRPAVQLREVLLIGDTVLSDGGAFRNVRATSGWAGWAFIGSERAEEPCSVVQEGVLVANRWSALVDIVEMALREGGKLDQETVVILDIDKTLLAARGRNDKAIDRARVAAIEATLQSVPGASFEPAQFRHAYATLNVPSYHRFTADNQDYLAYTCLMLSAGFTSLDALQSDIAAGRLDGFRDLAERVDAARDRLPTADLRQLHDDVVRLVRSGDPTPFKDFRRRELEETVARMGNLGESVPLATRLSDEICMTQEVVDAVTWLRDRGCLVVASSDKPDEATTPSTEMAARGVSALHTARTHVVGPSILARLPCV